jgi:acetyltransferase-like isoleucine patch superfamily enzyme
MNPLIAIIKAVTGSKALLARKHGKGAHIHYSARIRKYGNVELSEYSIIRAGVKIRNNDGKVILGASAYLNEGCVIQVENARFSIGENSFLNDECMIIALANIMIGKNVMVGPRCCFVSANHNFEDLKTPMVLQGYKAVGIEVGDDVWIGINSTITDGVKIGSGSIVAAGSVVTKDIGEYEIWGGVPAKFIRKREKDVNI